MKAIKIASIIFLLMLTACGSYKSAVMHLSDERFHSTNDVEVLNEYPTNVDYSNIASIIVETWDKYYLKTERLNEVLKKEGRKIGANAVVINDKRIDQPLIYSDTHFYCEIRAIAIRYNR